MPVPSGTIILSVVCPAYQAAETIERSLRSLRSGDINPNELIVVDDASTDATARIGGSLADRVIAMPQNAGSAAARRAGAMAATGDIIVFVDADIVVRPDTLRKIRDYMAEHPDVAAVTGRLSVETPSGGFFSRYKNVYMNYVFGRLSRRVTFLYGSICAVRARHVRSAAVAGRVAVDTALGQDLVHRGLAIDLINDVEVVHLKTYNARSFFRNDFRVAFAWTGLFLRFQGWRQVVNRGAFAHASNRQIGSLVLAGGTVAAALAIFAFDIPVVWAAVPAALWAALNARFFRFLARQGGLGFGLLAVPVTFVDQLMMLAGIASGFAWRLIFSERLIN